MAAGRRDNPSIILRPSGRLSGNAAAARLWAEICADRGLAGPAPYARVVVKGEPPQVMLVPALGPGPDTVEIRMTARGFSARPCQVPDRPVH